MLLVHILRDGVPLVPPFPVKKIPSLIRANSITRADFYWHEGMSEWVSVGARWPEGINFIEDDTPAALPATVETDSESEVFPAAPAHTPHKVGRWERSSLLREAQRRYHETLAPWGRTEAAGRAS